MFVCIKKEKGLSVETNISICNLPLAISFALLTKFDHFQRQIKFYVRM